MILFKGNSERLKREFEQDINHRLKVILFSLGEWLKYTNQGTLVITHLIRTQGEQDEIYTSPKMRADIREKYLEKKWQSVHQCGRGADIGIANLDPKRVEKWLNETFRYNSRNFKPTAIFEELGWGSHIHCQVSHLGTTLK